MAARSLLNLSIRTLTATMLTMGNMAMAPLNMDQMHNLHPPRSFTQKDQVAESAATHAVTLCLMKIPQQDAKKMIVLPSTKDAPQKFKKRMGEWVQPRVGADFLMAFQPPLVGVFSGWALQTFFSAFHSFSKVHMHSVGAYMWSASCQENSVRVGNIYNASCNSSAAFVPRGNSRVL